MNKFLIALAVILGVGMVVGAARPHETKTHHYHEREVSPSSGIVCTTEEEVVSILEAWKTGGYNAAKDRALELATTTLKQPCAGFLDKIIFVNKILKRERLIDVNGESFIGVIISLRNGNSPIPVYAIVSEEIPGEGV